MFVRYAMPCLGSGWLRDCGEAEIHGGSPGAPVDLGKFAFGAGQADHESFDFAEPAFTLGLGDAGRVTRSGCWICRSSAAMSSRGSCASSQVLVPAHADGSPALRDWAIRTAYLAPSVRPQHSPGSLPADLHRASRSSISGTGC